MARKIVRVAWILDRSFVINSFSGKHYYHSMRGIMDEGNEYGLISNQYVRIDIRAVGFTISDSFFSHDQATATRIPLT